jgi:hypothetical protein
VAGGQPTDTDLRGTFVWVRRDGRWRDDFPRHPVDLATLSFVK